MGFEGRSDYAAIGAVTNLASRLADEATAGQVLIAQRLYAEVEDVVDVEPAGEFTLKGFQRPVPAFNVLAVRAGGQAVASAHHDARACERLVLGWPCARVLGVPHCESALVRGEIRTEIVVEARDRRVVLEELILEPALGIARVLVSLGAIERGAALVTGHVTRPEHVRRGSAADRNS